MHEAHPDPAGLFAGRQLIRDRAQELWPQAMIYRLSECKQQAHFFIGELLRRRVVPGTRGKMARLRTAAVRKDASLSRFGIDRKAAR